MADLPTEAQSKRALERALDNAVDIITKGYLDKLETYEIVRPSAEDTDIDPLETGAFYKLTKLVWDRDESFLDKLTTIVNVVYSIKSSLVTIITSDGRSIDYYIGILSKEFRRVSDARRREADRKAFSGALSGNMIGSEFECISGEDWEGIQKKVFGKAGEKSISSISGIAALRNGENADMDSYVQGIENLIDSIRGMKYTILMIADPISVSEVREIRQGYEMLYTQLSAFGGSTVTMTESDAQSMSQTRNDGITRGISTGISMTQSKTMSKSRFKSTSISGGIGVGVAGMFNVNAGVGAAKGENSGNADTKGQAKVFERIVQEQHGTAQMEGSASTVGKSLQISSENRTVKALQEKIDHYLERLDRCESFGAFSCASYCFADTREEALAVAGNYNAIFRGRDSSIQASHVNTWYMKDETELLYKYLTSYVHPRFFNKRDANNEERVIVSPASIINGNELAIQVGFPKKSVSGITVLPMAAFGRNMPFFSENRGIPLGALYHMGRKDASGARVSLNLDSIAMHTFITGSTGAGKSTMIYHILDELAARDIPDRAAKKIKFLVIEPAKGEYKNRYGSRKDVFVYGSNPEKTPLLRINPFSFPEDIHVLEHIDRLIEIFNVCWPMYAAMPAVLKEAVERAYMAAGWDLQRSSCKYQNKEGVYLYPTFADVLRQINLVMEESSYSADSKGDYKGALCTRVKSLTNGIYGQIFTADELSGKVLFDENVIVDLSRIGSAESKALIMGILVMKLQEYRMGMSDGMNLPVRHVTVLEEAHHILKRISPEGAQESANVAGKSVELLANSIAEMRTYGEGFIIADQSPGLIDMSVIRNTNTKIILRLPDLSDRELVGRAAGLSEEQILEVSKFPTFVAAVYQNNWTEPVLCRIEPSFDNQQEIYSYHRRREQKEQDWITYISLLIMPVKERNGLDRKYVDGLKERIYKANVSAQTKIAFINYLTAESKEELQKCRRLAISGFFNAERVFSFSRDYANDYNVWYRYVCNALFSDPCMLKEEEIRKVIANLVMENAEMKQDAGMRRFFEKLINL